MRHDLHTEITIDAEPRSVWDVLVDLPRYAEWNPFIVEAEGAATVGERLEIEIVPVGGTARTFRPTVTDVEPGVALEWLGRLWLPGVFDGRHRFELHPAADGGTVVTQGEAFRGLLVRPLRASLDAGTADGFEAMNAALKDRVESLVRGRS